MQGVKPQNFAHAELALHLAQDRLANGKLQRSFLNEKFAFWTKYCFSCLVDADCTDTADFCGTNYNKRLVSDFSACLDDSMTITVDGIAVAPRVGRIN